MTKDRIPNSEMKSTDSLTVEPVSPLSPFGANPGGPAGPGRPTQSQLVIINYIYSRDNKYLIKLIQRFNLKYKPTNYETRRSRQKPRMNRKRYDTIRHDMTCKSLTLILKSSGVRWLHLKVISAIQ